jgi:hypothetical protein
MLRLDFILKTYGLVSMEKEKNHGFVYHHFLRSVSANITKLTTNIIENPKTLKQGI